MGKVTISFRVTRETRRSIDAIVAESAVGFRSAVLRDAVVIGIFVLFGRRLSPGVEARVRAAGWRRYNERPAAPPPPPEPVVTTVDVRGARVAVPIEPEPDPPPARVAPRLMAVGVLSLVSGLGIAYLNEPGAGIAFDLLTAITILSGAAGVFFAVREGV